VAALVPLGLTRIDRVAEENVPSRSVGAGPTRDRNVGLLTLWGCLLVSGQYALLAFLALDIHHNGGFGLATASLFVAVANASGIVGRIAWGALSDRVLSRGRKPLLLVLTAVGLLGALLLLATPRTAPTGVLVGVAAVAGLALIGYQGLWVTMIAEAAGARARRRRHGLRCHLRNRLDRGQPAAPRSRRGCHGELSRDLGCARRRPRTCVRPRSIGSRESNLTVGTWGHVGRLARG